MIEHLGFFYGLGKILRDFLSWKEEVKVVDNDWLNKSGFRLRCEGEGYTLLWSNEEKIPSRRLDEWDILWEVDKKARIRRKLKNRSDQVLLGQFKKKENQKKENRRRY